MALSNDQLRDYSRRLLLSRMRILCNHGFFGLLLMHMRFSVDEAVETACTDGEFITFGTDFLSRLNDSELDFVMMHEIMHVALQHCMRGEPYDPQLFNIACDIVVNSNILLENKMDERTITLRAFGDEPSMHLAPGGKEGHLYTAEEVYALLSKDMPKKQEGNGTKGGGGGSQGQDASRPSDAQGDAKDRQAGGESEGEPSQSGNRDGKPQSGNSQAGQGGTKSSAAGGANAKGAESSSSAGAQAARGGNASANAQNAPRGGTEGTWDDHSRWGHSADSQELSEVWAKRVADAAEAISVRIAASGTGTLPLLAERLLKEIRRPRTDWRAILADFVQEDITDYSFSPPDRRFPDSPFFLPDFNEKEERLEDILFMIDTSASMSDDMITEAYSEILGAIEQFGGKLRGWLGFFDATVTEPSPFASLEEFRIIRPKGGGGTSFLPIFRHVNEGMREKPPASIVILTDGYAPFPDETIANGIPVLWLLNNDKVTPPFGRIARITE